MLAVIYSNIKNVHTVEIVKLHFLAIKISFPYSSLASFNLKSFLNLWMSCFYLEPGEIWEQNRSKLFLHRKFLESYERIIKENTGLFQNVYIKYALIMIGAFKQKSFTWFFKETVNRIECLKFRNVWNLFTWVSP